MEVICHQCGIQFEKADKEIRRQEKEGRNYFFCNRSCTAISANKIRYNTPNDGLTSFARSPPPLSFLARFTEAKVGG